VTNEELDPGYLSDPLLNILAAQVDDLETARVANENRYRQLIRVGTDSDGLERGLGLPETDPEVMRAKMVLDGLHRVENQAISQMEAHMAASKWGPFLAQAPGVGEKSLARLLSAIGDPYWHVRDQKPRTVGQLWRYCGYDVIEGSPGQADDETHAGGAGVARVRRKGQKIRWSPEARKRAFVIAKSCRYQPSDTRYRAIYLATRAKYEDAIHKAPCVRCGPEGKPALTGSALSKAHKDGRALREVSKRLLQDLYAEAERLYKEAGLPIRAEWR
jgi:hypothetical protein